MVNQFDKGCRLSQRVLSRFRGTALLLRSSDNHVKTLLASFRAAPIAQLIKAQLRRPQHVLMGVRSQPAEWVFSKLPFSPLLSYLGDCEVLNAQTCNDPRQRWGNNLGRGGGSPPASQLAELFWDSWHGGKLRQTKVYQFRNGRPIQKPEKARKGTKKYRNTKGYFWMSASIREVKIFLNKMRFSYVSLSEI